MMLKTEYKYIHFVKDKQNPKTSVWLCYSNSSGTKLGTIAWDWGWKQYVFQPLASTQHSAGCLSDIAHFMRELKRAELEERDATAQSL